MATRDAEVDRALPALEADGRLLCWRCRSDVDDDLYCAQCGAVSTATFTPTRPARTIETRRVLTA